MFHSNAKHARKHRSRNRKAGSGIDHIEAHHRTVEQEGLHNFRNFAVDREEEARVCYTATVLAEPAEVYYNLLDHIRPVAVVVDHSLQDRIDRNFEVDRASSAEGKVSSAMDMAVVVAVDNRIVDLDTTGKVVQPWLDDGGFQSSGDAVLLRFA